MGGNSCKGTFSTVPGKFFSPYVYFIACTALCMRQRSTIMHLDSEISVASPTPADSVRKVPHTIL
jgi:hypothetical protein